MSPKLESGDTAKNAKLNVWYHCRRKSVASLYLAKVTKTRRGRINSSVAVIHRSKQVFALLMKMPNARHGVTAWSGKRFLVFPDCVRSRKRGTTTVSPTANTVRAGDCRLRFWRFCPVSVLAPRRCAKGRDGSFIAAAMSHEIPRAKLDTESTRDEGWKRGSRGRWRDTMDGQREQMDKNTSGFYPRKKRANLRKNLVISRANYIVALIKEKVAAIYMRAIISDIATFTRKIVFLIVILPFCDYSHKYQAHFLGVRKEYSTLRIK